MTRRMECDDGKSKGKEKGGEGKGKGGSGKGNE
jgi:hypothetical protein